MITDFFGSWGIHGTNLCFCSQECKLLVFLEQFLLQVLPMHLTLPQKVFKLCKLLLEFLDLFFFVS
jgi:hypothetical protein